MFKETIPQLALVLSLAVCVRVAKAQDSLPDLVRQVKPSVVSVLTYNSKGEALISGSGFFVRPDRSSLTCMSSRTRNELRFTRSRERADLSGHWSSGG